MRFVPIKTAEQRGTTMLMKTRELLICQQTQLITPLCAHMHKLGIITGKSAGKVSNLIAIIREDRVPERPHAMIRVGRTLA